jgi:hypothetical protein
MAIFTIDICLNLPAMSALYKGKINGVGMSTARELADILLGKLTDNQRKIVPTLVSSSIELADALSATLVDEHSHQIPDKDVRVFMIEVAHQILEKV